MTGTDDADSGSPETTTVQGTTAVGIVLVVVGTVLDVGGIERIVLALGLALSLAGIVYLAAPGTDRFRYAVAFAAVVTGQLALFGGAVRLVGLLGLLAVFVAVAVTIWKDEE